MDVLCIVIREMALPHAAEASQPMDEEAFPRFCGGAARPLWAYLARITGDGQLADDLLQEAYYRFIRARATYEDEWHRRNSLFRIATNLARDSGRRARHGRLVELPEEHELPVDGAAADRVARRMDVRRALAQLQPSQREMLWLAYAQGSSHDEIAAVLGVTRDEPDRKSTRL